MTTPSRLVLPRFQVVLDLDTSLSSSSSATPSGELTTPTTLSSISTSISQSIVNLSATAIGTGIVSLPFAFSEFGVGSTIGLIILIGALTHVTLQWLVECLNMSKKLSFSGNVKFFLGSFGYAVFMANLVLLLFGGSLAMFMMGLQSLQTVFGTVIDIVVMVFVLGIVVVVGDDPGGTRLGFTSVFALACVAYFAILILVQIVHKEKRGLTVAMDESITFPSFVSASSIVVNLFIMNFIVYHIARGSGGSDRMKKILTYSVWLVIVPVYLYIGIGGYIGLGPNVPSNILLADWTISPWLVDSGRVALALVNLFKLPLLIIPLRHNIFPPQPVSDQNGGGSFWNRSAIQSCVLLAAVFVSSYLVSDLATVYSWTGTTCGIGLGFMIPAAMYFKLQLIEEEQADLARRIMTYHQSLPDTDPVTPSAARRAKDRKWKKISSACVFIISGLYAILGVLSNLALWKQDGRVGRMYLRTYMRIFSN